MSVTTWLIIAAIFGVIVMALLARFSHRIVPSLNQKYFLAKWTELLDHIKTPHGMAIAIIDADKLLDEALRRRGYRGKTTGERLVAAQRKLSDNDGVWYAHKLRNRLVHEPNVRLKKNEVKDALGGFRQALKDLGAL